MDILALLRKQATTRKDGFPAGTVPDELIEQIRSSILQTANASNRQSYSVIVLDRESAGRLGLPGDRAFVFCVDFHRLHACARALGRDFDCETPMQFATALIDVSLLAQSTVLAAQSLGLATRITNEVYHRNPDALVSELGLPEHRVFPMLAVSLGFPAHPPESRKGRLSAKFLFHENRYRIPEERDILEIIREYDSEDKNLALSKNWRDQGFGHYLEWFFDKWSPVVGSRGQNDVFVEALKRHRMI